MRVLLLLLWVSGPWSLGIALGQPAANTARTNAAPNRNSAVTTPNVSTAPYFPVSSYKIRGWTPSTTNAILASLGQYTGTNVSLAQIVTAAAQVQAEYLRERGVEISVSLPLPTNGIVTLNLFRTPRSQIFVAGKPLTIESASALENAASKAAPSSTNAVASAQASGPARTNVPMKFTVRAYEIHGDTLLTTEQLTKIFAKYTGTNVTGPDVIKAASELQTEYIQRGFATVKVMLPPQSITNGMIKLMVLEGRLAGIEVVNNHFFSSNNVMRALPSLRTNILLNASLLQAELDRANANRDRQIYPELQPGPETNTSALILKVKDRLPLHGRLEVNNNSTPGTSDQRVNANISYDNLWQYEHSLGLQYGFSPESWKGAPVPGFPTTALDAPAVSYYGAFYRAPLSTPESVAQSVDNNPTQFGYNEATHRFELPPSGGGAELSLYATRATTDTTLTGPVSSLVTATSNSIFRLDNQDLERSVSRDTTAGTRLSLPVANSGVIHPSWTFGLDYKDHVTSSLSTNLVVLTITSQTENGQSVNKTFPKGIYQGTSHSEVAYLPLVAGWNGFETDKFGQTSGGISCTFTTGNPFSDSDAFRQAALSSEANGIFGAFRLRLAREQQLFGKWKLSINSEGQGATQPMVTLEQFGIGGIGSVRGYQEGELYGDNGWYTQVELRAPPLSFAQGVGLNLSAFTDYGQVFWLDPQGRPPHSELWGAGFGGSLVLGAHLSGRVAVAWPLLDSPSRPAGTVRVAFGVSAQF